MTPTIAAMLASSCLITLPLTFRVRPIFRPRTPASHHLYFSSRLLTTRQPTLATPPTVKAGDRIAQLILERIRILPVEEVDELDDTTRGAGGFGSTGVAAVAAESASKVSKLTDGADVKSAP